MSFLAVAPVSTSVLNLHASLDRGEWLAAGLDTFVVGTEVVGLVTDPFGTVLSAGIGWVIEHLQPLTGWLDELAGEEGKARARAEAVTAQGRRIRAEIDAMSVLPDGEWSGEGADAYRSLCAQWSGYGDQVVVQAESAGRELGHLATVVVAVRETVKSAISDVLASAAKWATATALTGGVASPGLIARVTAKVAYWAGRIGRFMTDLVRSIARLDALLGSVSSGLSDLARRAGGLGRGPRHVPRHRGTSRERLLLERGASRLPQSDPDLLLTLASRSAAARAEQERGPT